MRKIALVDLDDTLFDTKKFKAEYLTFLRGLNNGFEWVPLEIMAETYEKAKVKGYFDADAHCALLDEYIASETGVLGKTKFWLEKWLESEKKMLESLVFLDTEPLFRILQHLDYPIYILTLGTEWFQAVKIEGSGLAGHVDGYVVTQDPTKRDAITAMCDPEKDEIILIDDSKKVIDAVKKTFPRVCAVQVLREDNPAKVSSNADAIAKNLGEAMGALLSKF
ncbi:MAG: hypothetical protein AAB556_01740 [Patescibacteria group bacterium]